MRTIFLDNGGILAIVNQRDALHEKAVNVNNTLKLVEIQFIITDYILVKVCNALSKHKKLAIRTLEHLQISKDIKTIKISDSLLDRAIEMYKNYSDKDWGLTDITSFVVMRQKAINEAFTGDHHFKQFGFKILL